jgi:hypothetical protein
MEQHLFAAPDQLAVDDDEEDEATASGSNKQE